MIDHKGYEFQYRSSVWEVGGFFEMLKNQFRRLNWVPIGNGEMMEILPEDETGTGMGAAMKEVCRDHGWLDLSIFDKEACHGSIRPMLSERFPDKKIAEEYLI